MPQYIALLRGINVGGNNTIAMPVLKALFEQEGFSHVKTYINSGNVIFTSDLTSVSELRMRCESFIEQILGLQIIVNIVDAGSFKEALKHSPSWWDTNPASRHNAIFVIPPATADDIIASIGETKPEYEQVSAYGSLIFWSVPIQNFSKTRWSKLVANKAYSSITIRNANTTKKLWAMLDQ